VIDIDGQSVHVPAHAVMTDVRGADSLRLDLDVEAATGTRVRDRQLVHPYFIQMKGLAHLSGRAAGGILEGEGVGFFETYR
jgi:hypothetical protein